VSRRSLGRLDQLIAIHGRLLADRKRNLAFARALRRRVRPGATVLDIGSGSGVWAVLAARLGAERAVAIEKEPLLAPIIRALARENGVADRVQVVCGDSRRLALPRAFDLIVCECVGNLGLDEALLPILADARARFLRRGGRLVPERLALRAAPVRLSPRPSAPIRRGAFDALAVHFPRGVVDERVRLLARPATLLSLDLRRTRSSAATSGLVGRWRLRDGRSADALALWVRLGLAPGLALETLAGTHWSPLLLGVEPLPSGPGELRLQLDLEREPVRWHVAWRAGSVRLTYDYAPLLAWGWLAPRLGPSRASHRRR
jgi:SAM-dependent methyltransferase